MVRENVFLVQIYLKLEEMDVKNVDIIKIQTNTNVINVNKKRKNILIH